LTRQLSRVLVSRPQFFAITEARNPFFRQSDRVDSVLVLRQWESLCKAFQRAGLEIFTIEPRPGLEDMCFTASQFFVGIDQEERSFAVPSHMLHRSRRDEVQHLARWYSEHGYRILDLELEGDDFLEGAGDLLWSSNWEWVWAGYGPRSTRAAVEQFAAMMQPMGFEVRPLEIVDPHFYHLNLCLAPLSSDSLLLYPGAFEPETLAGIRQRANVYEVSREDALQFVCNGVSVNGYFITARLSRRVEQVLGIEGIEPIVVDLSEFHKAGGSVASLKMLLP
jgi:N-dimethylarginine dimethylaminohydrolase